MAPVRLGGFVIHGDDASTLGACVDSLLAVCDDVVAVASCASEAVSEVLRERPRVRTVRRTWEGYGAARAAAAEALAGCDYLLFLDSDERLPPVAVEALQAWRASSPDAPYYALPVQDWVILPGRRFLYRVEHHVRLVRADAARWTASMIVHEALPPGRRIRVAAPIEHRFATSIEDRSRKNERYALLWAVRYAGEGLRSKPGWLQRPWHVVRDGFVKGAVWRGGLAALQLAWAVSGYHARKYALLSELRGGARPELLAAFRDGRYGEIFQLL
jgi:(heptosyl)LPS beta-1,4-glucosyltransferase